MRISMVLSALAVLLYGCGATPAVPTATPSSAAAATSPVQNATAAPPAVDAMILTVEAMAGSRTEVPALSPPTLPLEVADSIDVGGNAWGTAADRDALWVRVDPPVDAMVRIDARTHEITAKVPGGLMAEFGAGSLWVATGDRGLLRVDPKDGKVLATIPLKECCSLAFGEGAVWAKAAGGLLRIDPKSNKVVATIPIDCNESKGMAVGEGSVWLACRDDSTVVRIDALSHKVVARIPTGNPGAHDIAITPGAVWVTDDVMPEVARIDPRTNKVVATIYDGGGGIGITSEGGELWASDTSGIAQIDPRTNKVTRRVELGLSTYYGLEHVRETFWVSNGSINTMVYRVEP